MILNSCTSIGICCTNLKVKLNIKTLLALFKSAEGLSANSNEYSNVILNKAPDTTTRSKMLPGDLFHTLYPNELYFIITSPRNTRIKNDKIASLACAHATVSFWN
eukprot:NODE_21_length_38511_cov_0.503306.p15 type:complete len:105 gc:universal NODE_21_length_38511_cov_0.503306:9692-10006(+)